MSTKSKRLILDRDRIQQSIRRIAYQIYENNIEAKQLSLVGIGSQGYELGTRIAEELHQIDPKLTVGQFKIEIDKENPNGTAELVAKPSELKDKSVILVDDVLNSGRTMSYCLMALLEAEARKIEIAVLIDRGHRRYPIIATFSGLQLSTTLEEHIEVKLDKNPAVYLY
jgi:pyrimidine operon attenuation protein/uracil phosphoribosyltransferase